MASNTRSSATRSLRSRWTRANALDSTNGNKENEPVQKAPRRSARQRFLANEADKEKKELLPEDVIEKILGEMNAENPELKPNQASKTPKDLSQGVSSSFGRDKTNLLHSQQQTPRQLNPIPNTPLTTDPSSTSMPVSSRADSPLSLSSLTPTSSDASELTPPPPSLRLESPPPKKKGRQRALKTDDLVEMLPRRRKANGSIFGESSHDEGESDGEWRSTKRHVARGRGERGGGKSGPRGKGGAKEKRTLVKRRQEAKPKSKTKQKEDGRDEGLAAGHQGRKIARNKFADVKRHFEEIDQFDLATEEV
ncbi:uncharacterized protein VTP21DRAFT_4891 [Calcarisporiella thermophila]|uniref:uncharacterized protein n=1 Tax=Calcarisporiella thermophila TaxID=911321 RepID=UPI003743E59A